jgi:hypothetical protein
VSDWSHWSHWTRQVTIKKTPFGIQELCSSGEVVVKKEVIYSAAVNHGELNYGTNWFFEWVKK